MAAKAGSGKKTQPKKSKSKAVARGPGSNPWPDSVDRCGAKSRQTGEPCGLRAGWGTDHPGIGRCKHHGGSTPITHGRYSKIKAVELAELIAEYEADPDPLNMEPELAAMRALFHDFVSRYSEITQALLAWHASFQDEYAEHRRLEIEKEAHGPANRVQSRIEVIKEREEVAREEIRTRIQNLDRLEEGETWEDILLWAFEKGASLPQTEGDADWADLLYWAFDLGREVRERADPARFVKKPRQVLDISDAYRMLSDTTRIIQRITKDRQGNAISKPDLFRVMGEMARTVETFVSDPRVVGQIRDAWMKIRVEG